MYSKIGAVSLGVGGKYPQHSDMQYLQQCVGMSLFVGMCQYVQVS